MGRERKEIGLPLERWTREDGTLTAAALRAKLENRGYRVSRYTYPPGTVFPDHAHDVDKIDAVLSGQFRMEMNGAAAVLTAGDCLAVPKGAVHRAAVVGDDPVVSLDATRA